MSSGPAALDTAALAREVRRLAFPAIVHSSLQTLVFVVDRALLGRVSRESLAAMQMAGTVEWSVFSILLAFEVGVVARVGFYVGAKQPREARAAAGAGLVLALVFGLVVALVSPGVIAALPLLAPGASPHTLAEARAYLGVTLPASPIVFLGAGGVAVLQATGDTRRPLFVGLAAHAVHLPLAVALIGGVGPVPALGARGCGVATAVAFGLEAIMVLGLLWWRPPASLAPAASLPRGAKGAATREIMHVAWPSILERSLYHAGFLGFVALIGRLGDGVMAANQILISVEAICFLSADGFGIAAAALVAQKLGARDPAGARAAARIAARDATILLTLFGVAAVAARHHLSILFRGDQALSGLVASGAVVLLFAQPFMAVSIVLAQALRGAGRTREVLAVTSVSATVVRLSATYGFAFALAGGLSGVWWGSTVDWMVRAAGLSFVFNQTFRRITRGEGAPT